jgi:hypothetical protein
MVSGSVRAAFGNGQALCVGRAGDDDRRLAAAVRALRCCADATSFGGPRRVALGGKGGCRGCGDDSDGSPVGGFGRVVGAGRVGRAAMAKALRRGGRAGLNEMPRWVSIRARLQW